MAWTTPMTAVAGAALNAADFNTHIRDNLNMTGPGVATAEGRWLVGSASKTLAERDIQEAIVTTNESTGSTAYTNLSTSGPSLTLTTGSFAIVSLYGQLVNATAANGACAMSFEVSGATTIAADDAQSIVTDGLTVDNGHYLGVSHGVTLTPGSNTFTCKYKAGSGTAWFSNRRLVVWSF